MEKPVCKCGNEDYEQMLITRSGPHKKLICKECTSYIKFVSTKQAINLVALGVDYQESKEV